MTGGGPAVAGQPQGCHWSPAVPAGALHPALLDPWEAGAAMGEGTVIALLTSTEGPAYRNLGAAMAISPEGRAAGAITSGCVEADLILQAARQRGTATPARLRYGLGSPFFDMKLPCGGGIEVTLFTLRDPEVLAELARQRAARRKVALHVSAAGRLSLRDYRQTGPEGAGGFTLGFLPPLRHVIFGAGAEALVFAGFAARLEQDHLLVSHDAATLGSAHATGCKTRLLDRLSDLGTLEIDDRTAVTLFYHDHDYEPEILRHLLQTPAFYIGAQGSRRAQALRLERLAQMGVPAAALARLRGPIGLIPSTRDAQSLAISVLAEITEAAIATTEDRQAAQEVWPLMRG